MHLVRHAELRDRESLEAIFCQALADAPWLSSNAKARPNFSEVSSGETVIVCCSPEDQVIGFVSVYVPESFVHHLYVARSQQGRGVGRALLYSLESWLSMPWRLKCLTQNERALAFYLSQGWAEEHRALGPEGPFALLMRCEA
ncbi:GNAT family N-acetyltransferase [Aquabacterium humicola]|uniref:GNAT family N-acetyltransferase n=1 Tax=Aquabacterium humicola TaxID=3237377 RepID=UPI0025431975|nr:GNAT family N-acetyltransferase [Rubrivivax pictus]